MGGPTEQAKEIYDKFYGIVDEMYAKGYIQGDKRVAAKKCSIFHVDELIEITQHPHWYEVKEEIMKL